MKSLIYYLKKAHTEHWAIGQFNFSDFSQVKGIIAAAQNLKAPIILGTSEGESKFFGLQEAVAVRNVLRRKTGLPIFLNLDHGKSFSAKGGSPPKADAPREHASGGEYSYIKEAILVGYDMVHFDGSKLPLDENIKISRQVVSFAKWRGAVVEGEVGRFGTDASRLYQEKFEIKDEDLTNVKDAVEYVKKTKVNLLAVNVGTFHGIDVDVISPPIKLDRLREIRNNINVPLVLHGGSGTSEQDIKEAIKLGIVKININTEIRLAFSNALRKTLEINRGEIVPYKYLPEAIDAVQLAVEEKIKLFGSENKA